MGLWSQKIVDELYKIKPPFNVNKIAQLAAVEAFKRSKLYSKIN
jgi:histidinol-phosphate aminotransferase